ncbi:conserved hypothetical protein [Ricinus communis]|uniref:RNase H type-1 domain-containing protein n=1 Tax=Ricinus communis TaxID=3988 RepID=B9SFR6_RICCO|nr:conserved hypothetical protein [Ricinus communis]
MDQILDSRWVPPQDGWMKINTDTSFHGNGSWGLGAIIRDSRGDVQVASNMVLRCGCGFEEAKAMIIVLESNCLTVVVKLKDPKESINEVGSIIQSIKEQSAVLSSVQ